jgi:sodium-dependent dicarboxylate transporter 2/3/5
MIFSPAASKSGVLMKGIGILVPFVAAACVFSLLPLSFKDAGGHALAVSDAARAVISIAVFLFGLMLTRPVPLWVTALLPFVLFPLFDIAGPAELIDAAASEYVFALLCALLMASGISYWKLDRRLALLFFRTFGPDRRILLIAAMGITGFVSMWTASSLEAVLVLPIVLAFNAYAKEFYPVADPRGHDSFVQAATLGVSFAITLGALSNIVGSPLNHALYVYSQTPAGAHIELSCWFIAGLSVFAVGMPVTYLVLRTALLWGVLHKVPADLFTAFIVAKEEELGPVTRKELFLHGVVCATVLGWFLSYLLQFAAGPGDLSLSLSAVHITFFALLILLAVRIAEGDLTRIFRTPFTLRQPWWVTVYVVGIFALAYGFEVSGAATLEGSLVTSLLMSRCLPEGLLAFGLVFLIGNFLPTGVVASLGSVFFVTFLLPIGGECGQAEIALTMLPAACLLLPLGGTHAVVMYASGVYTMREYAAAGSLIAAAVVPLIVVLSITMTPAGTGQSYAASVLNRTDAVHVAGPAAESRAASRALDRAGVGAKDKK